MYLVSWSTATRCAGVRVGLVLYLVSWSTAARCTGVRVVLVPAHMLSPVLLTSWGRASLTGLTRMVRLAAKLDLSLSGHSTPAQCTL